MFTKTDIEKYFTAEKNESLFLIIIGFSAILVAFFLYFFLKTNFYKGIALPLCLVAVIQITVGFTVYKRSDSDRHRNVYAYDMNPAELSNKELPRIRKVKSSFIIYRWIEIVLIIGSLAIILLYRNDPSKSLWYGIGVGMFIQAAIMLTGDYFAETRAKIYTNGLEEISRKK